MRQLEAARRMAGKGALACLIAGASALAGCGSVQSDFTTSHTITIQVQDVMMAPVPNVTVTAWVIDVDLPAEVRTPIEVGTAPTDEQGQVRFAYTSADPPYVCGWEVWSPSGQSMLAQHPPVASDNLSSNGYVVALIP
jgi:hypothetical protein